MFVGLWEIYLLVFSSHAFHNVPACWYAQQAPLGTPIIFRCFLVVEKCALIFLKNLLAPHKKYFLLSPFLSFIIYLTIENWFCRLARGVNSTFWRTYECGRLNYVIMIHVWYVKPPLQHLQMALKLKIMWC